MNTTLDNRPGSAERAVRRGARRGTDLIDDLGRRQVAGEAALPGGAERAGHAAAGLAGDAHRDALAGGAARRVAHQHALDQRAVVQSPQRLAGGAVVGGDGADLVEQPREQRGAESAACYLQLLLADALPGIGRERLAEDMDRWGYSFRLGDTRSWFSSDAADARAWLVAADIIDPAGQLSGRCRRRDS